MNTGLKVQNESKEFPNRRIILKLEPSTQPPLKPKRPIWVNATGNLCSIRVNIRRNYGGIDPQANVSICNLEKSVMKEFMTQYFAPKNPSLVSIYAGYETLGAETTTLSRIFQGTVLWAAPTTGRPDVWFSMTCNENFFGIAQPICFGIYSVHTPAQIVEFASLECGNRLGLGRPVFDVDTSRLDAFYETFPDERAKYEFGITDFYFSNTFGNFLRTRAREWNGMSVTIMNGKIVLAPSTRDYNRMINVSQPKWTISSTKNVMIGIPSPNPTGVDLTTLFDPKLEPLDTFVLDSRIYPAFNHFKYWIQSVEYELTTREMAFYNKITARRGATI